MLVVVVAFDRDDIFPATLNGDEFIDKFVLNYSTSDLVTLEGYYTRRCVYMCVCVFSPWLTPSSPRPTLTLSLSVTCSEGYYGPGIYPYTVFPSSPSHSLIFPLFSSLSLFLFLSSTPPSPLYSCPSLSLCQIVLCFVSLTLTITLVGLMVAGCVWKAGQELPATCVYPLPTAVSSHQGRGEGGRGEGRGKEGGGEEGRRGQRGGDLSIGSRGLKLEEKIQ